MLTQGKHTLAATALAALGIIASAPALAQDDRAVTIVVPDEPVGLDGCNSDQANMGRIIKNNVVESLTEIGPDGSVRPRLATAWNQVDDTTWRFTLHPGVTFHDGTALTAEAVVIAINRTMATDSVPGKDGGPATGLACRTRLKYFPALQITPRAVDESTLEITASQPVPILPTQMSLVSIVSPKTNPAELVRDPVGTGPYVFDHWTAGEEIVLRRNEQYWGEKPAVEQAKFVWRSDSSVRAAMVKLGEADLAPIIAIQDADNPATDHSYLNSETTWLRIDTGVAPLNDVRVRKALTMAVDRDALRDGLLPKDSLSAEQPIVPSIPGHNAEIDKNPTKYDPEGAMKLIAEAKAAGVPVDQEITLIARPNDFPNSQETLEAITNMFQAVGLNVKLSMRESAQWTAALRKPFAADRQPTLLANSHDNNTGDPVISVAHFFSCAGDASMVCEAKFDEMIKDATVTPTGPQRVEKWQSIFQTLRNDIVPNVWLYHMVGFARVGDRIEFTPTLTTNSEIALPAIAFK
jgi:peptide/nickel transport system substrate-binding protein